MKIKASIALLVLPVILSSCSTPPPPQAFHQVDSTALVIDSLDDNTCKLIQPTMSDKQQNDQILTEAHNFAQHDTAVVILENYNEPQPGDQFRDRSVSLFVGLRGAGYKNIVFLQGKGVANPEGLITLADYD